MNIMCPQKFKGPTKFLRHTLDLGTTYCSPLTDPSLTDPGSVYNDTNCVSKNHHQNRPKISFLKIVPRHRTAFVAPSGSNWIWTLDPRYAGQAQREIPSPHPTPQNENEHASFGSLEEQVTRLHFLADRIPVLYLHNWQYELLE
jgi:hypothetical protein